MSEETMLMGQALNRANHALRENETGAHLFMCDTVPVSSNRLVFIALSRREEKRIMRGLKSFRKGLSWFISRKTMHLILKRIIIESEVVDWAAMTSVDFNVMFRMKLL